MIDVLVLGLGPAGASAAAAASARGCNVVALERKRVPGMPVQCAEFVPALLPVDAAVLRQRIDAMATFVEGDAPDVQPDFPGQMLDRAAFDASLVARAVAAGAHCRFGANVLRIAKDGAVTLADGTQLRARVIVGADGPRSRAGAAIGRVNTELVETRQISVPLKRTHAATDIFLSADIPGGYGWLFPKGGVANLGAGVSPAHRARLKPIVAKLHVNLRERVGEEILSHTGGAIPVGGMVKTWARLSGTLVLLAGDAAGLANPVTGAGIAAAVQSGRLAGEAAAGGSPEAYEEELDDLFRAALDRALRRRRELLEKVPTKAMLRRGWIAYAEYWE
ncbi:MAG TPA: NAD(P)/FAD-dependent oxidoreductase [Burkholderiales bacterium]|nr:NAD(P)/FAD-dependent oxidoreductase [Burkholderiales bacterium]